MDVDEDAAAAAAAAAGNDESETGGDAAAAAAAAANEEEPRRWPTGRRRPGRPKRERKVGRPRKRVEVAPSPQGTFPLPGPLVVVASFVADARTLVAVALTCKAALEVVRALPQSQSLMLSMAMRLMIQTPLPMLRAISVCGYGVCEVCGRSRIGGAFGPHADMITRSNVSVFAHHECLDRMFDARETLVPADVRRVLLEIRAPRARRTNVPREDIVAAAAAAAEAPTHRDAAIDNDDDDDQDQGEEPLPPPSELDFFVSEPGRLFPRHLTVSGVRDALAAAGGRRRSRELVEQLRTAEAKRRSDVEAARTHATGMIRARAESKRTHAAEVARCRQVATSKRFAKLDVDLQAAGLPTLSALENELPEDVLWSVLGREYDRPRLVAPRGWSQAVPKLKLALDEHRAKPFYEREPCAAATRAMNVWGGWVV